MDVRQQIVEVQQQLQKQGAQRTRKFLDEEIVWVLNKAQLKFRDSKLRKKVDNSGAYEIDQRHTDALRVWTVQNKELVTYAPTSFESRGILPSDYAYLLSDSSAVVTNCQNSNFNLATDNTYNLTKVLFGNTGLNASPFYTNFKITTQDGLVIDLAAGVKVKSEKSDLKDLSIVGTNIYFEQLGDDRASNSFMTLKAGTSSLVLEYEGGSYNGTTVTKQLRQYTSAASNIFPSVNRLTNHSMLADVRSTDYYKTKDSSPISTLSGGTLSVFNDENFIVKTIYIDYIRKPRKISLSLSQNCELPDEFHQDVCDLAVELILADIGDPRTQIKTQQNQIIG